MESFSIQYAQFKVIQNETMKERIFEFDQVNQLRAKQVIELSC